MLKVHDNGLHPAEPTSAEKLEQLDRILSSRVFQGSEFLITLLRYLVNKSIEDPDGQVKEYTIAVDVFRRGSEFDSSTNSLVRVQAKNLRTKLQAYYEKEGRDDRVLIAIPKGHYKVVFSYITQDELSNFTHDPTIDNTDPPAEPTSPVIVSSPRKPADFTRAAFIGTIIVLSAAVVLLAWSNFNLRKRSAAPALPGTTIESSRVWSPFVAADSSTLLVLSNPPLFRFLNNSDSKIVVDRAVDISPEQAKAVSEVLKDKLVIKQSRNPRLALSTSSYTGMGEATGLFHLTSLFRAADKELMLKQSRNVSADDLKNRNVILLGSTWVNDWVEKLPVKEDFVFSINASIENHNPQPGEEREYKPRYDEQTGEVEEDYALITVKPGVTDEHRLMILAGILSEGTQAAAEAVTKKEYLLELDRRLQEITDGEGSPKYYQVLLKVEVYKGIPTRVSVVALHPLKVTRA